MSDASPAAVEGIVHVSHPLLPRAAELHTNGRLDEAAGLYREILAELPHDFDATHLLGVIALQQGQLDAAQRLIHTALGIDPHSPAAMQNLGTCYMRAGQFDSALQWFELVQRLQPDSTTANINLGTVLHNMGRHGDAIPALRSAYDADPGAFAVCMLLGASLASTGEPAEAVNMFESAIRSDPENAEGWENLALALNQSGRHEEAGEAAEKALALKPLSSVALGALGGAQLDQGSMMEAIESYRKSISIAGPSANMLSAYGSALLSSGLNTEAIDQFKRALELDGSRVSLRWAMTIACLKPVYESESDSEASREAFEKALGEVEAWYRLSDEVTEPFMAVGAIQPFYIAYQSLNNRELLSRYGALCASWMATLPPHISGTSMPPSTPGSVKTPGKLRIGIVSAHIHQHSVWNAITSGWVNNIDHTRFSIRLFKLDATYDGETEKARSIVAHFEDQPADLAGWIRAIKAQELDVLIYPEIGMHPMTLQLACLRLAPVQAATWGHPETTGLPTMDIYISAESFEPRNAADNYSEKLVKLPNLGVYVEPLIPEISKAGLPSLNLPANEPLLLCPGMPFKYSPQYDDVWVKIARQLKKKFFRRGSGGRLVFFRSRNGMMDRILEQRLRAAFQKEDVSFEEHVSIIPALDRTRFFGLMQESALMLDTLGFSGFNTALQAIECALPVLAFEGAFMRGRLASAIMRRLDLPELVATSTDDFVQKAVELAGNANKRKKVRAQIIARRDVLFRDIEPVRSLERHLIEAVAKAGTSAVN